MRKALITLAVLLALFTYLSVIYIGKLKDELSVEKSNTSALLTDIERYQIDSTREASVVRGLQLSMDDYKRYRKSDFETINGLKLKIKNIEAEAKSKLSVYADILSVLQDTLIVKDSLLVEAKKVSMNNQHFNFNGVIINDTLKASFSADVTLIQAFYATYKWKFLWWKGPVKDIRQVTVTDNPCIKLKYSEYIKIK